MTRKTSNKRKRNKKRRKKREIYKIVNFYSNEKKEISKDEFNPNAIDKKNIIKDIERMPIGLYNLGLTCYMNSLLQCFFHINKFRDYLIENRNIYNNEQIITKQLSEVMYGLKYCEKNYFEPVGFKKSIGEKNKLFKGIKAADVKDLFFNIIDSLTNELNVINSNDESSSGEINFSKKEEAYKPSEKEFNDANYINKLFIGVYETEYLCPVVRNKKNEYIYSFQIESFMLFELEKIKKFYNKNDLSLDLCFKYYTKTEQNSSFYCNLCKMTHINESNIKIYKPPEVLVIILDRGKGKKFRGKVKYGKKLVIKNYIDSDSNFKNGLYKLIGISKHSGESSESGHYTAYCLNNNEKYYYFSDSYVREVKDENELFEGDAYLLFYQIEENNNNYQKKEDANEESEIEKLKNNLNPINSICNLKHDSFYELKKLNNEALIKESNSLYNINQINVTEYDDTDAVKIDIKDIKLKTNKNNNTFIKSFKYTRICRVFKKFYKYLILYIVIFIISIIFYENNIENRLKNIMKNQ